MTRLPRDVDVVVAVSVDAKPLFDFYRDELHGQGYIGGIVQYNPALQRVMVLALKHGLSGERT